MVKLDLLNTLAAIGAAKATFRSLHDAWADTTTPHGRLIPTVLGGLAEFERHLIIARTGEGRKRAKGRGVRSSAQADAAPAPRSDRAPRWRRRDADRHRPQLQRQPQYDQSPAIDPGGCFLGRESSGRAGGVSCRPYEEQTDPPRIVRRSAFWTRTR
jgi:hypothetical protein